jgi:hypothetical protein
MFFARAGAGCRWRQCWAGKDGFANAFATFEATFVTVVSALTISLLLTTAGTDLNPRLDPTARLDLANDRPAS